MKKYYLVALLVTLCFTMLCSCKFINKKSVFDYDAISYAELTDQDFQTIDYINQNSDIYFKFMGVMHGIDDPTIGPHIELEQGIKCEGSYDTDENKVFRNYIRFYQSIPGRNVLGITIGTKYSDSKKALEDAGFEWYASQNFNNYENLSRFSKGNVIIILGVSSESPFEKNILDDDEISEIEIRIHLKTKQIDTRGIE